MQRLCRLEGSEGGLDAEAGRPPAQAQGSGGDGAYDPPWEKAGGVTSGEGRGQIEQDSGHGLGQAGAGVKGGQMLGVPGPQSVRSSPVLFTAAGCADLAQSSPDRQVDIVDLALGCRWGRGGSGRPCVGRCPADGGGASVSDQRFHGPRGFWPESRIPLPLRRSWDHGCSEQGV